MEIIEQYKERILQLELDLELARNESEEYKSKLFDLIGLNKQSVRSTNEDWEKLSIRSTPMRMRAMLEAKSRQEAAKK